MAEYCLLTEWRLNAPLAAVWDAVYATERWPSWWRSVRSVEQLQRGDPRGIGARCRYIWQGRVPYRITFDVLVTDIEPLAHIAGMASGQIEGSGRWTFSTAGRASRVRYEWRIRPRAPWMRRLEPLARPLFHWNHNAVMREGGEGLARLLGGCALEVKHA